ncbi:hypothetical protein [Blastococcus sp. TF02A-26]|uniref:hypothetical protein n=1 Tax=Blastococcus sp. TF02A-26 TaxID=2250577 RepID=UPI000DEABD97|nr:hypothetical protein [Blastococcus sp. TF02A-26]RBY82700.1 hypothetical protein DQ240_18580 [Blastococcus sp. TF02A-26]
MSELDSHDVVVQALVGQRPDSTVVVDGVAVTALSDVGQGVVDRLRGSAFGRLEDVLAGGQPKLERLRPAELDVDVAACRVCGCTEDAACPGGCWWVPDPEQLGELCSQCGATS